MGGPLAIDRLGPGARRAGRVARTPIPGVAQRGSSRAVLGLTLAFGLIAAPQGARPEPVSLAAVLASAKLTMAPVEPDLPAPPLDELPGSVAGPSTGDPARSAPPRDARFDPTGAPLPSLPRPRLRPFAASGPLLARLADPAVRPRSRPVAAPFRPMERPGDLLVPDPPRSLAGATDLQCLAVAIYHEARDQSLDGQLAVASVILNRAREPKRWGARPCDIVVPGQFSFLSPLGRVPAIDNREAWAIAVEMAREALERGPSSLVGQADHYHTLAVQPDWQDGMERVIRIGDHIFYADASVRG